MNMYPEFVTASKLRMRSTRGEYSRKVYVQLFRMGGTIAYIVGRAVPEIALIAGTDGIAGAAGAGVASTRIGEALRAAGGGVKLTVEGFRN